MYNVNEIKESLKNTLSSFRYEHSLMVALEARKIAKHYGVDEEKAYVAKFEDAEAIVKKLKKRVVKLDSGRIVKDYKAGEFKA